MAEYVELLIEKIKKQNKITTEEDKIAVKVI